MSEYKRLKKLQSILALCFANKQETYHHWRFFSHGSDGACIEFDQTKLLWSFDDEQHIKKGFMKYRYMNDMSSVKNIAVDDFPFLKRAPYRDESEYRIIYVDMTNTIIHKSFDIDLDCITHITLSPWIAKPVASAVRKTLNSISGCEHLTIRSSTLVDNDAWKQLTSRVSSEDVIA